MIGGHALDFILRPQHHGYALAWRREGFVEVFAARGYERFVGRGRVVRSLTVVTDRGLDTDLVKTRLTEAVRKAGFLIVA